VACILTPAECFGKHVVAALPVTERAKGWWSMHCPVGGHGQPLRLHIGDRVHISYTDLGHCPESLLYTWFTGQGIPAQCLKRPNDQTRLKQPPGLGAADGKLADAVLDMLFSEGTPAERMVRAAILCLDGQLPEGPMCEVVADRLRVSRRTVYRATAEVRRRDRNW
jgi:hypothetical protein